MRKILFYVALFVAVGLMSCHSSDNASQQQVDSAESGMRASDPVINQLTPKEKSTNEKYPRTSLSGPEYQIIDDKGWPGKLEPWQHTGCNYAMQVPDSIPANEVGEWNTTRIVVNGTHVEHWLNGVKLLQYELWGPEWKKQKAAGKWKDDPEYGMSKSGHIALQYHGGDVWFRNIKLKTL